MIKNTLGALVISASIATTTANAEGYDLVTPQHVGPGQPVMPQHVGPGQPVMPQHVGPGQPVMPQALGETVMGSREECARLLGLAEKDYTNIPTGDVDLCKEFLQETIQTKINL